MAHKHNNLWWTTLDEENKTFSRKKESQQNTLLVLGAPHAGKSTLIAGISGVKIETKFQGTVGPLEYAYVNVCDPQTDDALGCINIWLQNDENIVPSLLNHAVNTLNYKQTIVILVFSLDTPWHWPKQWQQLLKLLKNHMRDLNLTAAKSHDIKRCQAQKWLAYASKYEGAETLKKKLKAHQTVVDLLPEAVLRYNLGLEFIVVVTKSDRLVSLQREHNYKDAHFNYMLHWLRHACLEIGAGLIYTSAQCQTNMQLFNNYLMEHFYGLPNNAAAQLIERNSIYIPAGWDNLSKIELLNDEQLDMSYEEFIIQTNAANNAEQFIETDEQAFFAKHFAELNESKKSEVDETKSDKELTEFFNNLSLSKKVEFKNFQTVKEDVVPEETRQNSEKYSKDAAQ